MDEEERDVNRKTWWIMSIILLVLVIGAGGYYIWLQQQQMNDMSEMFALEKEELFDDFQDLSIQYEDYKINIKSDSLLILYTAEQEKVQRLQEELRTVKSTNSRRINELKKELETLRRISQNLFVQIDSLNNENQRLKDNNQRITQSLNQQRSAVSRLTKDNEQLAGTVQKAAMLNAVNIQAGLLNSRGRAVKNISKATRIILTFTISKNIIASVGEQSIFVRLKKPDDDILTDAHSGSFQFENKAIAYSIKKDIEYDGEEQNITLYWEIGSFLPPGEYRVDIFSEGSQIGRKPFTLEK
jgi:Uncharacterized enzyme of heme biosynthesis